MIIRDSDVFGVPSRLIKAPSHHALTFIRTLSDPNESLAETNIMGGNSSKLHSKCRFEFTSSIKNTNAGAATSDGSFKLSVALRGLQLSITLSSVSSSDAATALNCIYV